MANLKIKELTKENEKKYLDKVAELEKIVLAAMEKDGKIGQLFITGKEDISEYVHSKQNTVMIAVDSNENVQSATYITQGQKAFTYNDITKYFKYGEGYKKYVKSLYANENEYKNDMLEVYKVKLKAYKYTKGKILNEHPEFSNDILSFLEHELKEENNHFHEKSILREDFNKYMSEYIENMQESSIKEKYEKFYWTNAEDISKEFGKTIDINKIKNSDIKEYEKSMKLQEEYEYNKILQNSKIVIHEKPEFEIEKYYNANTQNAVEIDTYITNPNARHAGLARILVYEGIKKQMKKHFNNDASKEIYLCSTLHRENLSSKYVSEFFGLKDSLYVKRRDGRDREVHICKIERQNLDEYLNKIQDKLIVLYNYNPENKQISQERKEDIVKEQIEYEKNELKRIQGFSKNTNNRYFGNIKDTESKIRKINRLNNMLNKNKEELER